MSPEQLTLGTTVLGKRFTSESTETWDGIGGFGRFLLGTSTAKYSPSLNDYVGRSWLRWRHAFSWPNWQINIALKCQKGQLRVEIWLQLLKQDAWSTSIDFGCCYRLFSYTANLIPSPKGFTVCTPSYAQFKSHKRIRNRRTVSLSSKTKAPRQPDRRLHKRSRTELSSYSDTFPPSRWQSIVVE